MAQLLKIFWAQKQGKANGKELSKIETDECPSVEPWEALAVARHSERPAALTYFRSLLDPFIELRGDRLNSDDRSIICGVGFLCSQPVAVIGQQRRPLVEGERYHVYPDGLRKAQRVIRLASRFKLPLITLIDTQGADPGLEAEEQGIGNAIARTLSEMLDVPTPIVSVVIGEGGSEGALALGLADRILMQQYAIYSPISLNHSLGHDYHDYMLDREAAEALMLTAHDCLDLGVADEIVAEPEGGSHNDPRGAGAALQTAILKQINQLSKDVDGQAAEEALPEVPANGRAERLLPRSHDPGSRAADEHQAGGCAAGTDPAARTGGGAIRKERRQDILRNQRKFMPRPTTSSDLEQRLREAGRSSC